MVARLGRRGRDRPARLVRRADHLHVVGLPDRQAVPRPARRPVRRSSTTSSSRAPTPSPSSTRTPTSRASAAATRRGSALVALVQEIMDGRIAKPPRGQRGPRPARRADLDQGRERQPTVQRRRDHRHLHLDDVRRAPHHLRHRGLDADRAAAPPRRDGSGWSAELDELYADGSRRQLPGAARRSRVLESALKETLRLHPPLILLLRVAHGGLRGRRATRSAEGDLVGGHARRSPTGSPRTSPTPTRSTRAATSTRARRTSSTGGPGSRSAPAGTAASAPRSRMMQLKAIFSVLLRDFEFEMAQPPDSYRNDHSKMVVQLAAAVRRSATAGGRREARGDRGSKSTWTCARGTRCASSRRRTSSVPEARAGRVARRDDRPTTMRADVERAVQYCPTAALRLVNQRSAQTTEGD